MGEGLQVDLLTELSGSYAATATATLLREDIRTRMFPVPGVSSILKGEKYITCAVEVGTGRCLGVGAAEQLIADVLSLTVDAKLRTLQERIEFSMKQKTAAVDACRFVSDITSADIIMIYMMDDDNPTHNIFMVNYQCTCCSASSVEKTERTVCY